MLSDEVATLLADFFQGGAGPSHDELSRIFQRADLEHADPGTSVGKVKRVRQVCGDAIDQRNEAGTKLVKLLVDGIRARGGFRESSAGFAGEELVSGLRRALRHLGYDLDAEGHVRPRRLENLEGMELTEALWSYVRRARSGATDAELVIGTAKNLEEATARHVLKERAGSYPVRANFPLTLYQAFDRLGLHGTQVQLDRDPFVNLEQAIFLLALAVNRLRNDRGDGHGRPEKSVATALEGRLSSQAAGLVSELLLVALEGDPED